MARCGGEFWGEAKGGRTLRLIQKFVPRRGPHKSRYVKLDCELEVGHEGDHRATAIEDGTGREAPIYWERRR